MRLRSQLHNFYASWIMTKTFFAEEIQSTRSNGRMFTQLLLLWCCCNVLNFRHNSHWRYFFSVIQWYNSKLVRDSLSWPKWNRTDGRKSETNRREEVVSMFHINKTNLCHFVLNPNPNTPAGNLSHDCFMSLLSANKISSIPYWTNFPLATADQV